MFQAKVIKMSQPAEGGPVLTTMQLRYPRFIHAEFMTHRVFSRNASSSRAIPVKKMLAQVWNDPATPIHWGKNQAGMQARETLQGWKLKAAKLLWKISGKGMCLVAWTLDRVGLHKQVANRLLEPWQFISVIVTATEWDNFFALRDHKDAQPEIKALAVAMKTAMSAATPQRLARGQWHLPYVSEYEEIDYDTDTLLKLSAARCARVSYLTHEGKDPSVKADTELHDKLVGGDPIHASPIEHQAQWTGMATPAALQSNLKGWLQYRKIFEYKRRDSSDLYKSR